MPATAYEEGAATAQSYIQGIIDNMGGINDASVISAMLGIGNGTGKSGSSSENAAWMNTPITINLNDKEYIKSTFGELIASGKRSGGNTFNL